MTIWFSSDHHFGHANIIEYAHRPFGSVEEMDRCLIERHNAYVQPSDHWYCLGDVTMARDGAGRGLEVLGQLNGHKRLIMGNHDHYHVKHYQKYFEKIMAMNVFDNMLFIHVPVHPRSVGRFKAIVHGHTHEVCYPPVDRILYPEDQAPVVGVVPYINICVEVTEYRPWSLEEIQNKVRETVGD